MELETIKVDANTLEKILEKYIELGYCIVVEETEEGQRFTALGKWLDDGSLGEITEQPPLPSQILGAITGGGSA